VAPGVRLGTEPESNTTRTHVAEINGEALIAFRAKGDDEAHDIINEKNGYLQLGLNGFNGVVRPDGSPLWDGETEIKVRPATDDEHETWREALGAETGEGKQIDPSMGGDRDAFNVYLVPTSAVEGGN
jgi:hypothetical protein